MQHDVQLLTKDDGALAQAAGARLKRRGHDAVLVLETGLYGAEAVGRLRIVRLLRDIGDPAAAPIVAHLAKTDPDSEVREAASACLAALTR